MKTSYESVLREIHIPNTSTKADRPRQDLAKIENTGKSAKELLRLHPVSQEKASSSLKSLMQYCFTRILKLLRA
jgi:hypothetical protein